MTPPVLHIKVCSQVLEYNCTEKGMKPCVAPEEAESGELRPVMSLIGFVALWVM